MERLGRSHSDNWSVLVLVGAGSQMLIVGSSQKVAGFGIEKLIGSIGRETKDSLGSSDHDFGILRPRECFWEHIVTFWFTVAMLAHDWACVVEPRRDGMPAQPRRKAESI